MKFEAFKPLGELATFTMGQAPSTSAINTLGNGVPFYRSGEFGEIRPSTKVWTTTPLRQATESDVLVCVVGANAGEINLGANGAIGRSVAAITPGDSLDQYFLYNFLLTQVPMLRRGSQGSVQSVISKDDLSRILIPDISLSEQLEISETLMTLNEKIESNLRLQKNGEELIRLLVNKAMNTSTGRMVNLGHYCDVIKQNMKLEELTEDINYVSLDYMPR